MTFLTSHQIRKSYAGVPVLKGVDLSLKAGTVTGLVGENGAGKSTLIKVLTGLVKADSGTISIDGSEMSHWNQDAATESGIAVIHQELLLVPELTVAQNMLLGQSPVRSGPARGLGVRDDREGERRSRELLEEVGITGIDVRAPVQSLSPSHAQMILIARSLRRKARALILDEPTAALAAGEREDLFALVRRLVERGTAILLVSHHLHEVEEQAHEVTVLRNGEVVAELKDAEITIPTMVHAMLDRSLDDQFPPVHHSPGEEIVLSARGLSIPPTLKGVDLDLRRGEILGITGLLGSGKTEVAHALVGLGDGDGTVTLGRDVYTPHGPREALRNGVLLVPEERKAQAIFGDLSVYQNGILSVLSRGFSRGGASSLIPRSKNVKSVFDRVVGSMGVKYSHVGQLAGRLSGGNQQKLVIGRALSSQPRVLVMDEPTRGVDIGSKREIYRIIVEQAEAGLGVVLISSDTPEVLALSHRVLVLRDGVVKAIVETGDTAKTNKELMLLLSPEEIPASGDHALGLSDERDRS